MATVNLFTTASISLNRHRIDIFERTSNTTLNPFASQTEDPPHPQKQWTFDRLIPSRNYEFDWVEIDSNNQIIQTYAKDNFTTLTGGSIIIKPNVDLEAGISPELVPGTNSAIFPDWIGWEITVEEVPGTMKRGQAYSWDATTGAFALLGEGHVFISGQRYFVRFEPKVTPSASIISSDLWSDIIVASNDLLLTADDIGKKIIIAGQVSHLNITLPDIGTVVPNRIIFFESRNGNHINASITSSNPHAIDGITENNTVIYTGRNENIAFYMFQNAWRVHSYSGNFKTVGRTFYSYEDTEDGAIEFKGGEYNAYEYMRLYNDHVLKQPLSRLVPYESWAQNPLKYSLANAVGMFKVPDVRGRIVVSAGAAGYTYGSEVIKIIEPGDFQEQQMLNIKIALLSDVGTGDRKPDAAKKYIAWSSNRQNGNQDYDLCKTDVEPTLGFSGKLFDQYGNAVKTGSELLPNRYAMRLFVNT